jgi:hypothetical protein
LTVWDAFTAKVVIPDITAKTFICLKIKPNIVRIRFFSRQIFWGSHSTGFEPTPLIHYSTNRLSPSPAPWPFGHTRYIYIIINKSRPNQFVKHRIHLRMTTQLQVYIFYWIENTAI